MASKTVYNPLDVIMIVDGYTITGVAEDSFFKVEPLTKESVTTQVGAYGDTAFTYINDNRYKIVVTLMGNSPSNKVLQDLANSKKSFATVLKNTSDGGYIGSGADSMIMTRPSIEFGKELKDIEWEVTVNDFSGMFTE